MATLKLKLFSSFIILSIVAIFIAITGLWLPLLKIIFDNDATISQIYSIIVISIGAYYFHVNKEKEGNIILSATILDCAAIIATFYTGISYFHELFSNFGGFMSILSEQYLQFVMANFVLMYWSLNQIMDKFRKTFYEGGRTEEIKGVDSTSDNSAGAKS